MISLRYFILCNLATIDPRNRLSCQGFFDSWDIPELPFRLGKFFVVVGIDGGKKGEKFSFRLVIRKPNGNIMFENPSKAISEDNLSPVVYIFTLEGFPVDEYGVYSFEIHEGKRIVGRYPLIIKEGGAKDE